MLFARLCFFNIQTVKYNILLTNVIRKFNLTFSFLLNYKSLAKQAWWFTNFEVVL